MEWLLEGNRRFREQVFQPQRNLFRALARGQQPRALWIGCSDSRVPANLVADAPPGSLFVHRNVGNAAPPEDPNLAAVVAYAVGHLGVGEIVLCGHTGCGAVRALAAGEPADPRDPIARWLRHLAPAREAADAAGPHPDPEARLERIVVENVRLQVRRLRAFPCVAEAVAAGALAVHGLVYRLDSGALERVAPGAGS